MVRHGERIEPVRTREAPRTALVERVCAHTGCETMLSRYNQGDLCSLHAPRR